MKDANQLTPLVQDKQILSQTFYMAVQSINSLTNYSLHKTHHNASARLIERHLYKLANLVQLALTGNKLSNSMSTYLKGDNVGYGHMQKIL
jgi:hypothetical protein